MALLTSRAVAPGRVQPSLLPWSPNASAQMPTVHYSRCLPAIGRCKATSNDLQQASEQSGPAEPEASTSGQPEVVSMDQDMVASKMFHAAKRMTASKRKVSRD